MRKGILDFGCKTLNSHFQKCGSAFDLIVLFPNADLIKIQTALLNLKSSNSVRIYNQFKPMFRNPIKPEDVPILSSLDEVLNYLNARSASFF